MFQWNISFLQGDGCSWARNCSLLTLSCSYCSRHTRHKQVIGSTCTCSSGTSGKELFKNVQKHWHSHILNYMYYNYTCFIMSLMTGVDSTSISHHFPSQKKPYSCSELKYIQSIIYFPSYPNNWISYNSQQYKVILSCYKCYNQGQVSLWSAHTEKA